MAHCGHGNCESTAWWRGREVRCAGPLGHSGIHLNIPGYYDGTEDEPRLEWGPGIPYPSRIWKFA